ncbi:hypothetical protein AGMMS49938_17200 [Fibrobacterales bacterium]|nr:hypothetical protein AGMMS49938_17200 [Fibrobacterales bacterium]
MHIFAILLLFLLGDALAQTVQTTQSPDTSRADLLGPVHISKIRTMDEVKGSYKSPKKAMFMSLLVPGSGQLYVGGQPRIIRGAFYIAEEIALISGLYYKSVYKYDKQVSKYEKFAKNNFSIGKYEEAMNAIFVDEYKDNFQSLYGGVREDYCRAIYSGTLGGTGSKCISFQTANDFYKNNYIDGMRLYNGSAYYRLITDESFVLGWSDAVPDILAESNYQTENPVYIPLGASATQDEYRSLRKKANELADYQAIFLGAIILNHIVSAVDAALSARANNNALYEEKVSILDRVRPFGNYTAGENFKAEVGLRLVW